jgi:hypothetical protein
MNLAVKFNLLKDTQPHYIYKPESCLENDNYKLYFDRTVLTDIHIQHNRPDIIILNKQQKQAYLLDIAVPNSHNITQTYRDIFLTLNIVHTYSLCSILKNTDQCIVSCYVTDYTEHQRWNWSIMCCTGNVTHISNALIGIE